MISKKRIFFPSIMALAILTIGILSTSSISAQDTSYSPIVEKIATHFNLNKDEVNKVFEEERDERHADMFANWAERLDDLVSEGKLTEEEKNKILDKHAQMQEKMDAIRDLEPEERQEKLKAIHEEMSLWAKENNINVPLMFGRGGFHKAHRVEKFFEKQN